jgi:CubicO group peptidase (beta-lactamase class C family)
MKEKITIRNLLNNTSGIREELQLLGISGTNITDVIRREHVIKVLGRQQSLDFKPGEQYRYSNSNFTLLAEIVRSVTGQSLRRFADSAIFKPLGMAHTLFYDNHTEIVENRSYSYASLDSGHFEKTTLNHSNVGSTGLLTNISDMSKWAMNFYQPRVGDMKDIEL